MLIPCKDSITPDNPGSDGKDKLVQENKVKEASSILVEACFCLSVNICIHVHVLLLELWLMQLEIQYYSHNLIFFTFMRCF